MCIWRQLHRLSVRSDATRESMSKAENAEKRGCFFGSIQLGSSTPLRLLDLCRTYVVFPFLAFAISRLCRWFLSHFMILPTWGSLLKSSELAKTLVLTFELWIESFVLLCPVEWLYSSAVCPLDLMIRISESIPIQLQYFCTSFLFPASHFLPLSYPLALPCLCPSRYYSSVVSALIAVHCSICYSLPWTARQFQHSLRFSEMLSFSWPASHLAVLQSSLSNQLASRNVAYFVDGLQADATVVQQWRREASQSQQFEALR